MLFHCRLLIHEGVIGHLMVSTSVIVDLMVSTCDRSPDDQYKCDS